MRQLLTGPARWWAGLLILLLAAAAGLGLLIGIPDAGGPDDGLLHLAGATALLRDGSYPIVQRPPLYSAVIALLAAVQGAGSGEALPLAYELGNIHPHEVAQGLLSPAFLRSLMVFHLALWALALLALALSLHMLGLRPRMIGLAAALALTPSSWLGAARVSEALPAAFLLMSGLCALLLLLSGRRPWAAAALAGLAFALAGITHASFQLLNPLLLLPLALLLRRTPGHAGRLFVFTLPWLLIVGGWSVHNYSAHGFAGVSGVGGVALATRTAAIVERAAPVYPEEAAVFTRLRDETYLAESNKENVAYWGARAANWLMRERGLSYNEANRLLLDYNLAAVRAAPLHYLDVMSGSLIGFHYPGVDQRFPPLPRAVLALVELALLAAFAVGVLLWTAAHLLARLGFFPPRWRPLDSALLLALYIYACTAAVTAAVDVGKPEQRFPVHLLLVVVLLLATKLGELRPDKKP